ncbi:MAG: hypothetical protein ACI9BW_004217 [Gammaproteobacteria bacterium]|jgi:hypothetical protein
MFRKHPKRIFRSLRLKITLPIVPIVLAVLATDLSANDDQSYAALREWISEKPAADGIQAGKNLSAADRADLLEPFIPRSAWEYYIFDDVNMEIAATADYPPPADWGSNTSKDYSLDERGVLSGFTGGGFPYEEIDPSEPFVAQKVIWNMLWRPGQDDFNMPMVTWLRSEGGKLDRKLEFTSVSSTYARGDRCLVDGYEEVKTKTIMEFRSPRDMAGAKDMSISYVDHDRENSGWVYLPVQRKPRRTLASERTSELMGMDMIREDMNGFGGKVHENNWTYLGTREVLATINLKDNPEIGGPHLWVPNNARWELRDTHVLLIEPKASNHPYSARIVFIDAKTYWTHWMFAFDREDDQLLRMNQHYLKYSESYAQDTAVSQAPYVEQDFAKNIGHQVFLHLGETDINAKKPHATITHCFVAKREFSPARARQFYSLRNMISGRR